MPLRTVLWSLAIVYWIGLFILTHVPARRLPQPGVSDKIMHLAAYGVLMSLVLGANWIGGAKPRFPLWGIVVTILIYGALDEWLQSFVGRSCEFGDWLADATGAGLALLVMLPFRRPLQRIGTGGTDLAVEAAAES